MTNALREFTEEKKGAFDALILAGGQGSRYKGGREPKVLADVQGKPPIGWTIESLQDIGVNNIYVSVGGPHREDVRDYVESHNKEVFSIDAADSSIGSIDSARLQSFTTHLNKTNKLFEKENFDEVPMEHFSPSREDLRSISEYRPEEVFVYNTQPQLMVLPGDSIYQKEALRLTSMVDRPYYNNLNTKTGARNLIGHIGWEKFNTDYTQALLDNDWERLDEMREGVPPGFSLPAHITMVHSMRTNNLSIEWVPKLTEVNDSRVLDGTDLNARTGGANDFSRRFCRKIGATMVDPVPYDYDIIFDADGHIPSRKHLHNLSTDGFLHHYYDFETGMHSSGNNVADYNMMVLETNFRYIDINRKFDVLVTRLFEVQDFVEDDTKKIGVEEFCRMGLPPEHWLRRYSFDSIDSDVRRLLL